MKNLAIFFLLFVLACEQKSKDKTPAVEPFFPVLSYIKSQVAHVDTSLYSIIKVAWLDSIHTDTAYIKREDFRGLARDFLDIPDLTNKKYKDLYTEEKFYDEGMNKVFITYRPKNTDTVIIQRQEVIIDKEDTGDKVSTFIIHTIQTSKDSSVERDLLWKVDHSFNVVTSIQKPDQKEITKTFKVVWE